MYHYEGKPGLFRKMNCLTHFLLSWIFLTIVLFTSPFLFAQSRLVDIGKSFANISKQSTGGSFEPNDVVEIRVTFAVRNVSPSQISAVQVFDSIPENTSYEPGSIRITTNEGITYKGPYTDAFDNTDVASCVAGIVQINLGTGATRSTGGVIKNTDRPSFYGNTCIVVACFRIRINALANYGDTIKIGGHAVYKIGAVLYTRYFPLYRILLSHSFIKACSNGMSVSAAADSLGTFASGITQSRAASLAFTTTYSKTTISTGTPNDYYYAIVNNSSADGTVNSNSAMPEASPLHRVFGLWDIAGDHTGAADAAKGNPATVPGNRGGYMVLINSSYNTDTAYKETLSNLCPGTYYEFSAWFRNLCPRCGCDSNGKGSTASGYITGPGNDSSGVKPNINFEIDGLAVYTSGDIKYSRSAPWKKFGFVFLTKPTQTTASFLIRNNSPGGGGNDWALDDINVSHCGPTLSMNITPVVTGCDAAPFQVNLSDTVRYIFDNSYVYWQWQKSNTGGTVWYNLTGPGTSGVGTPAVVNGQYQYVTNLPSFLADVTDSGKYYRVITATTLANLSGNCAYNDGTSTMINVMHCGLILSTRIKSFTGSVLYGKATLNWTVEDDGNITGYEIEKSMDGTHFSHAGVIPSNTTAVLYHFTDPVTMEGNTFYRLKMMERSGLYHYSSSVLLLRQPGFDVYCKDDWSAGSIDAGITVPEKGWVNLWLVSTAGQFIQHRRIAVNKGLNTVAIECAGLPAGVYILTVESDHVLINRKIIHFR